MDRARKLRVVLVLALVSLVAGWLLDTVYLTGLAALFLVVGLVSNRMTGWIADGWMKLARMLGAFNTTVIMGVVFYVFLTPLALVYRLLGKGSIRLHPSDEASTYFVSTEEETVDREDFEKTW